VTEAVTSKKFEDYGFADWYTEGKVDLGPFVDELLERVLRDRRPA
jgi:hypothetical protein